MGFHISDFFGLKPLLTRIYKKKLKFLGKIANMYYNNNNIKMREEYGMKEE